MQLVSLLSHCATDPGLKSGISVHKLISTLKKKKKDRQESIVKHSPQILAHEKEATTTTTK